MTEERTGKKNPVIEAAKEGDLELLRKLIEYDSDIASTDDHGNNALHYASYQGYNNMVLYLLKNNLSPAITNKAGNSALHLACESGKEVVVKAILRTLQKNSNNNNSQSDLKNSPSTSSSSSSSSSSFSSSSSSSALLNLKNLKGQTPLHVCCLNGHLHLVLPLIFAGASTSLRTSREQTIFDLVPKDKYEGLRHLLNSFASTSGSPQLPTKILSPSPTSTEDHEDPTFLRATSFARYPGPSSTSSSASSASSSFARSTSSQQQQQLHQHQQQKKVSPIRRTPLRQLNGQQSVGLRALTNEKEDLKSLIMVPDTPTSPQQQNNNNTNNKNKKQSPSTPSYDKRGQRQGHDDDEQEEVEFEEVDGKEFRRDSESTTMSSTAGYDYGNNNSHPLQKSSSFKKKPSRSSSSHQLDSYRQQHEQREHAAALSGPYAPILHTEVDSIKQTSTTNSTEIEEMERKTNHRKVSIVDADELSNISRTGQTIFSTATSSEVPSPTEQSPTQKERQMSIVDANEISVSRLMQETGQTLNNNQEKSSYEKTTYQHTQARTSIASQQLDSNENIIVMDDMDSDNPHSPTSPNSGAKGIRGSIGGRIRGRSNSSHQGGRNHHDDNEEPHSAPVLNNNNNNNHNRRRNGRHSRQQSVPPDATTTTSTSTSTNPNNVYPLQKKFSRLSHGPSAPSSSEDQVFGVEDGRRVGNGGEHGGGGYGRDPPDELLSPEDFPNSPISPESLINGTTSGPSSSSSSLRRPPRRSYRTSAQRARSYRRRSRHGEEPSSSSSSSSYGVAPYKEISSRGQTQLDRSNSNSNSSTSGSHNRSKQQQPSQNVKAKLTPVNSSSSSSLYSSAFPSDMTDATPVMGGGGAGGGPRGALQSQSQQSQQSQPQRSPLKGASSTQQPIRHPQPKQPQPQPQPQSQPQSQQPEINFSRSSSSLQQQPQAQQLQRYGSSSSSSQTHVSPAISSSPTISQPGMDFLTFSSQDVKNWFHGYKGGKYKDFYACFLDLDGEELFSLREDQFRLRCPEKGDLLFNAIHSAQPSTPISSGTPTPSFVSPSFSNPHALPSSQRSSPVMGYSSRQLPASEYDRLPDRYHEIFPTSFSPSPSLNESIGSNNSHSQNNNPASSHARHQKRGGGLHLHVPTLQQGIPLDQRPAFDPATTTSTTTTSSAMIGGSGPRDVSSEDFPKSSDSPSSLTYRTLTSPLTGNQVIDSSHQGGGHFFGGPQYPGVGDGDGRGEDGRGGGGGGQRKEILLSSPPVRSPPAGHYPHKMKQDGRSAEYKREHSSSWPSSHGSVPQNPSSPSASSILFPPTQTLPNEEVIFSEDFASYPLGHPLVGQGGWQTPTSVNWHASPAIIAETEGLTALGGSHLPITLANSGRILNGYLIHSHNRLPRKLTAISHSFKPRLPHFASYKRLTLSFTAYSFQGNPFPGPRGGSGAGTGMGGAGIGGLGISGSANLPSHNAGVYLGDTRDIIRVGFFLHGVGTGPSGWIFDPRGLTESNTTECLGGITPMAPSILTSPSNSPPESRATSRPASPPGSPGYSSMDRTRIGGGHHHPEGKIQLLNHWDCIRFKIILDANKRHLYGTMNVITQVTSPLTGETSLSTELIESKKYLIHQDSFKKIDFVTIFNDFRRPNLYLGIGIGDLELRGILHEQYMTNPPKEINSKKSMTTVPKQPQPQPQQPHQHGLSPTKYRSKKHDSPPMNNIIGGPTTSSYHYGLPADNPGSGSASYHHPTTSRRPGAVSGGGGGGGLSSSSHYPHGRSSSHKELKKDHSSSSAAQNRFSYSSEIPLPPEPLYH